MSKIAIKDHFDTDLTLTTRDPPLNEPHNDIHEILMAMMDINNMFSTCTYRVYMYMHMYM